jgi:NAD(P)-dependent dehydrogenase (short-subunit alcohol dehydrogenase family)
MGATMLLFFAPGLLRTTGFLVFLIFASLALGVWVAAGQAEAARRRWLLLLLTYVTAGIYATLWTTQESLRQTMLGGALAAFFLLAQPAYSSGALVVTLRGGATTAAATAAGVGFGAVFAATVLIPRLDADVIFLSMATALLVARLWYERTSDSPQDNLRAPMTGKTVVVTGFGNRGQVGYALAAAFVKAGARVMAVGRSENVEDLAREIAPAESIIGMRADLTDPDAVDRVIAVVRERFGRLDALINAAGGLTLIKPLAETNREEWRNEIQRNGDTAFLASRAALPLLRESRGCIVNFASVAGIRAVPQLGAYSAGKAAVVALTRALAIEEKKNGVRVNAIAPGMIDTDQNRGSVENPDQVHWISREQITQVVLFLCSDAGSGVNGETVHVLGTGIS